MPNEQPSRFTDSDSEMGIWRLGSIDKTKSNSKAVFPGQDADDRMREVRRAISDIRLSWGRYAQFRDELKDFVERQAEPELIPGREDEWKEIPGLIRALLSSRKEWPERGDGQGDVGYSAVRLYTSEYGYKKIFQPMNTVFRNPDLTAEELRAVTFLVELLNIDLYRHIHTTPEANNFTGSTYRGMRITSEALDSIRKTAADNDLKNRYVAIPLSMMSTSNARESAMQFAARTGRNNNPHALLWDISVYGMDPAYLASYRRSFPDSIVTSMCAVPINGLSYYHVEDEVLLRGPFFQIVRMYEDNLQGEALHVIQAVMLNSNRDHVTAIANNEGEDLRMREIFRDMAIASRSARCAQHAERCGLTADADYYRSEATRARTGFSDLM
jgi:hypothetical protein